MDVNERSDGRPIPFVVAVAVAAIAVVFLPPAPIGIVVSMMGRYGTSHAR